MLEQQFEQKAITESSLADLRQLLNDISEHVSSLTLKGQWHDHFILSKMTNLVSCALPNYNEGTIYIIY
jgi:hypothetical protein